MIDDPLNVFALMVMCFVVGIVFNEIVRATGGDDDGPA